MEISAVAYDSVKVRLENVLKEIEEISKELETAVGFGDLSENTEYDAAKLALNMAMQERDDLERILRTARVKYGYSTTIQAGSLISVKKLHDNGEVEEDLGLLMFDEIGDLLFEGKINPDSPLGASIKGGVTGIYKVLDIKGHELKYGVTLEPESRIPEFLQQFAADRKTKIKKMFSGAQQ